MSLTLLNHKTMLEAKKKINEIINKRQIEGFEYPINLSQCSKVNVKFNKYNNAETLQTIECFYAEWIVDKFQIENLLECNFDNEDLLEDKKEFEQFNKQWLEDYLSKDKSIKNQLLDYCLNAILKCSNRVFDMTMMVKTDFVSNDNEPKCLPIKNLTVVPTTETDKIQVFYESDYTLTDNLFQQLTSICFGKEMSKLGCEYALFWQHCYKNVFKMFDDDDEEEEEEATALAGVGITINDYYDIKTDNEKDIQTVNPKQEDNLKIKKEQRTKFDNVVLIKRKLMKRPQMNKVKVRNQKYKELANTMKQYIIMSEDQGRLVHNFKSPCPLQCLECSYDVKSEKFTFIYCYAKKYFSLAMDPIEGHIMIQHYSNKIIELMD